MLSHRMSSTRLYYIWGNMIQRCTNPKVKNYHRYGGRGVTVCKEWLIFDNFLEDMRDGYADNLSIDRIDNDKGYCKENCRWTTRKEQSSNMSTNVIYQGETASSASRRLTNGKSEELVRARLALGWEIEKAFNHPLREVKRKVTLE